MFSYSILFIGLGSTKVLFAFLGRFHDHCCDSRR